MKVSDSLTITLAGDDVALIIRGNGDQELFIPGPKDGDEDALVPQSALAILVLANQLHKESVAGLATRFTLEMAPGISGPGKGDTVN